MALQAQVATLFTLHAYMAFPAQVASFVTMQANASLHGFASLHGYTCATKPMWLSILYAPMWLLKC